MAAPILPPDKGTPYRTMVDRWASLWHGRYQYPDADQLTLAQQRQQGQHSDRDAEAAPGYTRSWSLLVAGLFQKTAPTYTNDTDDPPLPTDALSDLLKKLTSTGCGFGSVLLRPVFDGTMWVQSLVRPTRSYPTWVHERLASAVMWEYAPDPRYPAKPNEPTRRGLAIIEEWTANPDGPGTVTTTVWETEIQSTGTVLTEQVNTDNPPAGLEDHPYVTSAANDQIARDVVPYVWEWEDLGPVPLYYPHEKTVEGLARSWDQEQDDAEMARRRIAMPTDALSRDVIYAADGSTVIARPGWSKHENLLTYQSGMSAEHGPSGGVTPIEFGDSITDRDRQERRTNEVIELCGINPQSIGRSVTGRSDSGTAKRADNQMTMQTITAPARRAETALTLAVAEVARLNSNSTDVGSVQVHEGLKETAVESAETARALREADAASTYRRVEVANPNRPSEWVDEEVDRINQDAAAQSRRDGLFPIEP